jgi:hypothetical protein
MPAAIFLLGLLLGATSGVTITWLLLRREHGRQELARVTVQAENREQLRDAFMRAAGRSLCPNCAATDWEWRTADGCSRCLTVKQPRLEVVR